jgi:hypothetical protein
MRHAGEVSSTGLRGARGRQEFSSLHSGSPHHLFEGERRSGTVLSGLLDPSKPGPAPFFKQQKLLDLGFLEFHVLPRDWIVLLESELLGLGPRVLFGHVEIACIGGRRQLDLDYIALGHESLRMNELRAIDLN